MSTKQRTACENEQATCPVCCETWADLWNSNWYPGQEFKDIKCPHCDASLTLTRETIHRYYIESASEPPAMNERNDKMKFIDEYVCDALDMGGSRNPDEIYSDAVAEWEGSQTDAAHESHRDRKMSA